ncbi:MULTISPECIES: TRAP transporter substrate-binding protein [Chromohalobacter]|uniref:TRAP transporter substrate-binding protein n=1 Tax=Chromohalobacter TaxID=42054 RepID=UPI001FFDAD29|nr:MULTISPECIES: TRAP transporter substrate-binding protein [Chromohalobacter]MCK2045673.1 TRAP transporter substrate-binding protein [Chromohalobacter moromii]MCT8468254.1 TRAP transporter substrate-binding protein [Chromohalobacter canadensis]MCT8471309.1 TRAP transporter substrate-binding protein [Chromohalobacter canadensis]MCT8498762.1 TRAP transporter substrate-binding protein [Chromohalobacter canadensis]
MLKQLLASAVIGSSILAAPFATAADYTLKFGHLANEENIWNKAAERFKKVVEEESDGRIDVQIFPNEQLGTEMEVINSIQLGTADMTITGESLQNWAPKAAMMAVPYAFRDSEHLRKAVEGDIGKQIEQQIEEKAGLVPIAWFERGPRELTSNQPIKKPSDLDGLRLRVPNVPLFVDTWQALGAKPTPMAFSEVFTSLQQGTIDGQENPLSLIESASFNEVQDYVNMTDHVRSWIYVVIGKNKLESMPEDLQEVVLDAAQQMQSYEAKLFSEDQKRLRNALEEAGMEFVEVDQKAFADKAEPAVKASLNDEQQKLYEAIQDL